eukprot:Blabericola_migrator_1__5019@NODE_2602_length_2552_cov_213_241449_g1632_i0_p1_GENE_NODE_2602_length_2552_cov_213_241449_g1632_i0NODE_2602_length_2552_cov_213_241449_g1632_i0_p1_ORF_typecomplete_len417_score107_68La/PF05383_17/3e15La/PF05383_17/1_3e03DUF3223/PF11523_8/1_8e14RRM_3/PF08777_11/0_099DUF3287/PF11690_8/8_7e03DUF3287/PF11690_8/0_15_NODE_2602_length_2552_cov_213_241449_g1632_i011662416
MAESGVKRELPVDAPETEAPDAKRPRLEEPVEPVSVDLSKVRRQVEYYLSDDNLKFDKFFHEIISADTEGRWLPFEKILSCRRIQQLGATTEDIVKALADSETVEASEIEPGRFAVRRRSSEPLPALEERPPRRERQPRPDRKGDNRHIKMAFDVHISGCLIKLSNVPAEASWETLKLRLAEKLPRSDIEKTSDDGSHKFLDRAIQYVSPPDSQARCYAIIGKFDNDQQFFKDLAPLDINGAEVPVELLSDMNEVNDFMKQVPSTIRKRREREIAKKKQEMSKRPITLGDIEWQDIEHLRESLKGVLKTTAPGSVVNAKTKTVLQALLKYHPNGGSKLRDLSDFKVDVMAKEKGNTKDITKCFWVVRSDGTAEDFSLQKCLTFLSANPPFVEKSEESPKQAASAATTADEATPAAA